MIGAALIGNFWVAVPLYLASTFSWGLYIPIKQGWINDRIPSSERATIISLDALFGDAGNTGGQLGLGYLSTAVSIPFAWLVGGAVQALGMPLLAAARRAERAAPSVAATFEGAARSAAAPAAAEASPLRPVEAGPNLGCFGENCPVVEPGEGEARESAA